MPPIVYDIQHKSPTAMDHVNQWGMTSNLLTSGKSSMDTLGTFYCSTRRDSKNEMFCLPFSIEYPNVQSTTNHRIQEMENAADMMRTSIMALRCEEEEESSLTNKSAYLMPCCQLVGKSEPLHRTHSTEEAEVQNSKVSNIKCQMLTNCPSMIPYNSRISPLEPKNCPDRMPLRDLPQQKIN